MPAGFGNENVVGVLPQRFIGVEAEEASNSRLTCRIFEPRVIMMASGAAFNKCSRKFDGEPCSALFPRSCRASLFRIVL